MVSLLGGHGAAGVLVQGAPAAFVVSVSGVNRERRPGRLVAALVGAVAAVLRPVAGNAADETERTAPDVLATHHPLAHAYPQVGGGDVLPGPELALAILGGDGHGSCGLGASGLVVKGDIDLHGSLLGSFSGRGSRRS